MGWRTVVVNQHSKLSYKNSCLVFKSVYTNEMIHLSEIDIIILETTDITLTTMLIKRLIDEHVIVIFCDDKRLPKAKLAPYYSRHDSSLQLNRQISWKLEQKQIVWTEIISQKILNQYRFLIALDKHDKADAILNMHNGLKPYDPTNREGHAARIYFHSLFHNQFSREEESAINAAQNYGYTLLMSVFAREIVKTGCMTQMGLKHANQFNDFNLASDLMEPFRPIVDQIVYDHRHDEFPVLKRALLDLFTNSYTYNDKSMFLTNIVSDYTKKIISIMNHQLSIDNMPAFGL